MSGARVQVALLTGRSDPSHCLPSAAQARLLASLAAPDIDIVPTNFPWSGESTGHAPPVPLLLASARNARDYLGARRPGWTGRHRPALHALLERSERTVLLCGSCGLELCAGLVDDPVLTALSLERVDVFAYGPVARGLPPCRRRLLVQGRRDRLSRLWFPAPDLVTGAGHMNYLDDAATLAAAHGFVRESVASLPAR